MIYRKLFSLLFAVGLLLTAGCSASDSSVAEKSGTTEEEPNYKAVEETTEATDETAEGAESVISSEESSSDAEKTDEAAGTDTLSDLISDVFEFIGQDHEWMTAHYVTGIPRSDRLAERFITTDAGFPAYTDESGEVTSSLGIDVSQFQGDIDWAKVADSGIEFAIVRVALRGYGEEGNLHTDTNYQANLSGAASAGLTVGAYFFSQAVSEEDAVEEAEFLLDAIDGYSVTGPIVYDLEEITNDTARTDGMSTEQITACAVAFCNRIREAGYEPVVYANLERFIYDYDLTQILDYEWWLADYNEQPQLPYVIRYWQFSSSGSVPGISGSVDLDLCFE